MSKAYHFIGIGGVGMSALAHILLSKGEKVSGSDQKTSKVIEGLIERGATISLIQKESNIEPGQTIVYSTAIKDGHPEFKQAKLLGLAIMHRSDLLREVMGQKKELVIAGAHGKTTVSSLLSHVLAIAEWEPSFAVGGFSPSLGVNGKGGAGEYFVAEGDESDGSFLKTEPYGAILNNIESDHVGYYWKSYDELLEAYRAFTQKVQNKHLFLYNGDDPTLKEWKPEGVSFGLSKDVQVRAENISFEPFSMKFDIVDGNQSLKGTVIPLLGIHNVMNATAVYGLATRLGVDEASIRAAFLSFKGVERRMQIKSDHQNILVIDDYAHHPTEILTTVAALENSFPARKVIKVVQPHRHTRVTDLLNEFVEAFEKISEDLIVTDIYAAGESPEGRITTEVFLDALERKLQFQYVPQESLASYLAKIAQPGDIILMMGAGDITKESENLSEQLKYEPV